MDQWSGYWSKWALGSIKYVPGTGDLLVKSKLFPGSDSAVLR